MYVFCFPWLLTENSEYVIRMYIDETLPWALAKVDPARDPYLCFVSCMLRLKAPEFLDVKFYA